MHHRPGAHDARFERDIERSIQQTIILQYQPALAQRHDLRVSRRIVAAYRAIPAFTNDLIIVYQYRTDGHFPFIPGSLSEGQSVAHPVFMGKFCV
ncbi:hypothetical protein VW41_17370 [Klebsiella michiganensis]|nr:hypothetical protein VW41_17370 [Klebsiella michiganensis]